MIDTAPIVIAGLIKGQRVEVNTKAFCEIDRDQLEEEFARQAHNHAWITATCEQARSQKLLLEADLEDLEADLYGEILSKILGKNDLSETAIKQRIKADPKRRVLVRKIIEADDLFRQLQAVSYAMIHRDNQLDNLCKARGGEMSNPSPMELRRVAQSIAQKRK
jgi:hypothetical protein